MKIFQGLKLTNHVICAGPLANALIEPSSLDVMTAEECRYANMEEEETFAFHVEVEAFVSIRESELRVSHVVEVAYVFIRSKGFNA